MTKTARESREQIRHTKRLIGSIWSDIRVGDQYFDPITRLLIRFEQADYYCMNQFVYRPLFLLDDGKFIVPAIDLEDLLERENKPTGFRRIS